MQHFYKMHFYTKCSVRQTFKQHTAFEYYATQTIIVKELDQILVLILDHMWSTVHGVSASLFL